MCVCVELQRVANDLWILIFYSIWLSIFESTTILVGSLTLSDSPSFSPLSLEVVACMLPFSCAMPI